jgi:hypothetical protein
MYRTTAGSVPPSIPARSDSLSVHRRFAAAALRRSETSGIRPVRRCEGRAAPGRRSFDAALRYMSTGCCAASKGRAGARASRQLIGCTARPWSRRRGLICKILTTGDCRPRYGTAIVVGSRRRASSQWTAERAILHLSTCCGLPAKTDSIPGKDCCALKRSVRTSRRWEAEEDRSPLSGGLRVGGRDVAAWLVLHPGVD